MPDTFFLTTNLYDILIQNACYILTSKAQATITEAVMIDIYNTWYISRYYLLESLIIKGFTNSLLKVMSPNYKLQEIYLSTDF